MYLLRWIAPAAPTHSPNRLGLHLAKSLKGLKGDARLKAIFGMKFMR